MVLDGDKMERVINCKDCKDNTPLVTMKELLYRAVFPCSSCNFCVSYEGEYDFLVNFPQETEVEK